MLVFVISAFIRAFFFQSQQKQLIHTIQSTGTERKLIYLINPIAGTKEKSSLTAFLIRKTKYKKIPFEILPTLRTGEYQSLKKKIYDEKITDVIICGGDGSVSAVAGSLLDVSVRIGIIPLGSGNGLAMAAGISTSPVKALDVVFKGNASAVDGFLINGKFSCMLCGIGFDAQVAHDFAKKKRRGLQTYIRISVINFFKAKPFPFIIESKQRSFNSDAFFVSVANSNQFGNNFTIAPRASLKDGLLDIVVVKKMNKLMLPFSILGQVTGINALQNLDDYVDRKNITYFQTSELSIYNPGLAPLHIDGDPQPTAEKFEIKILPAAFRLIQPL